MENIEQSLEKTIDPSNSETGNSKNFSPGDDNKKTRKTPSKNQSTDKLDFLLDIPVEITVEIGRTKMLISDLLKLGHGSIIGLTKLSGESMEVLANQKLIAKGEVVSVENKYGIRLTEIISPKERVESLK